MACRSCMGLAQIYVTTTTVVMMMVMLVFLLLLLLSGITLLLSDVSISNGLHIRINTHHRTYDDLVRARARARACTHTRCGVNVWSNAVTGFSSVCLPSCLPACLDMRHIIRLLYCHCIMLEYSKKSNHTLFTYPHVSFDFDVVILVARVFSHPQPYTLLPMLLLSPRLNGVFVPIFFLFLRKMWSSWCCVAHIQHSSSGTSHNFFS